jgi:Rieske Fe-S protein
MANGEGRYGDLPGPVRSFISEATEDGFLAWLNKCTHFCCTPGFKNNPGSEQYNAGDRVYCQCHQSVYNPFSPTIAQFVALPRPLE